MPTSNPVAATAKTTSDSFGLYVMIGVVSACVSVIFMAVYWFYCCKKSDDPPQNSIPAHVHKAIVSASENNIPEIEMIDSPKEGSNFHFDEQILLSAEENGDDSNEEMYAQMPATNADVHIKHQELNREETDYI